MEGEVNPIENQPPVEVQNDKPAEFVKRFKKSQIHESAYKNFFEDKQIDPAATDRDKDIAFYDNKVSTDAMLEYYLGEDNKFKYNPENFSEKSREAMERYIEIVKKSKTLTDRKEILNTDIERSSRHATVGRILMEEGIVPSIRTGRMLARIVLTDQGIETIEDARSMH